MHNRNKAGGVVGASATPEDIRYHIFVKYKNDT